LAAVVAGTHFAVSTLKPAHARMVLVLGFGAAAALGQPNEADDAARSTVTLATDPVALCTGEGRAL
jgi:hypothetical protein